MKKTVGACARDLLMQEPDKISPIEIQRQTEQDYIDHLHQAIKRGTAEFTGNFYIQVTTKQEKLMHNVIRNFFQTKHACPTPDYDQTVFYYDRNDESCTLIWVIPSKDACHYLLNNAPYVPIDEYPLLDYVKRFSDGDLYLTAKKLNNEKFNSIFTNQLND